MAWYVYILECSDGTLYTGITNDLSRRIAHHNNGNGCKYTRCRTPVKLLYNKEYSRKGEALKQEASIKALTRAKKLELINRARSKV